MCPGMAAEALGLGDASAEKVEQDLASPWACSGGPGWIWVLCDASTFNFRNDSTGSKDGGATGLAAVVRGRLRRQLSGEAREHTSTRAALHPCHGNLYTPVRYICPE